MKSLTFGHRTNKLILSGARRDDRAAEGARLLSECRVLSSTEGSNPSLSASIPPKVYFRSHKRELAEIPLPLGIFIRSFPRKREASQLFLDSRFRGNDVCEYSTA
jgi:hypothetical protein